MWWVCRAGRHVWRERLDAFRCCNGYDRLVSIDYMEAQEHYYWWFDPDQRHNLAYEPPRYYPVELSPQPA